MSVLDTLITDRTEADAKLKKELAALGYDNMTAAQKALWDAGLKGAYKPSDLNRVGQAVLYLQDYLNGVQSKLDAHRAIYHVAPDAEWTVDWDTLSLTMKTDWARTDKPTAAQMETYLTNITLVTACIAILRALPSSMGKLTAQGANAIEDAILREYDAAVQYVADKEEAIENAASIWWYSGEIYGGEY